MGAQRRSRAAVAASKKRKRRPAKRPSLFPPALKRGLFEQAKNLEGGFDGLRADLVEVLRDRHFKKVPLSDLAYAVRCLVTDSKLRVLSDKGLPKQDVAQVAQTIAARFDFQAAREHLDDGSLSEAVTVFSEAYEVWLARKDAGHRV